MGYIDGLHSSSDLFHAIYYSICNSFAFAKREEKYTVAQGCGGTMMLFPEVKAGKNWSQYVRYQVWDANTRLIFPFKAQK